MSDGPVCHICQLPFDDDGICRFCSPDAAADQTKRVILHVGLGTPFPCACNNEKQHVKYVPAAAFDAARERAERAEAELAKAKAVIEAFRVMLREPYKIQEIDGWKDAVKALSILDEKANP